MSRVADFVTHAIEKAVGDKGKQTIPNTLNITVSIGTLRGLTALSEMLGLSVENLSGVLLGYAMQDIEDQLRPKSAPLTLDVRT